MEVLIADGVDVNHEDAYGNTALDWEEVETDEDFHFLLLEAGARHGSSQNETNRLISYVTCLSALAESNDIVGLRRELNADIQAGAMVPIRLFTEINSRNSRGGDTVEAIVIAPVVNENKVPVRAGVRLEAVIMVAGSASDKHQRAELILGFSNLHHADDTVTRLVSVDNARETVDRGRILGMAFPHSQVSKWNWGLKVLKYSNPVVAQVLRAGTWGYGKTLDREISYSLGTEMWLQVTVPERVNSDIAYPAWSRTTATRELTELVRSMPARVRTPRGTASDVSNLMFVGPGQRLETEFKEAGWVDAASINLRIGFKTFQSILRNKGYERAPFSTLLLEGAKPRYEYRKQLNTFAKRHHLRTYQRPEQFKDRTVWVASATHDIGIGVENRGAKWDHVIDSRIDRERQKIVDDLMYTKIARSCVLISHPMCRERLLTGAGMNR